MTKFEDELREALAVDDRPVNKLGVARYDFAMKHKKSHTSVIEDAAALLLEILPEMREMVGWRKNGSQDLYSCESGASGYYKICDGGGSYISGDFVYDNDAEMFVYLANATTTLTEKLKKAGVV